jgi:hypothetical protein
MQISISESAKRDDEIELNRKEGKINQHNMTESNKYCTNIKMRKTKNCNKKEDEQTLKLKHLKLGFN